jgi:hypothetical protein
VLTLLASTGVIVWGFVLQAAPSANGSAMLYILVPINTAGALGLAYAVGKAVQRFNAMEERIRAVEQQNTDVMMATLTTRVEGLNERIESIHRNVHDLRNIMLRISAKQDG